MTDNYIDIYEQSRRLNAKLIGVAAHVALKWPVERVWKSIKHVSLHELKKTTNGGYWEVRKNYSLTCIK